MGARPGFFENLFLPNKGITLLKILFTLLITLNCKRISKIVSRTQITIIWKSLFLNYQEIVLCLLEI